MTFLPAVPGRKLEIQTIGDSPLSGKMPEEMKKKYYSILP